MLIEKEVIGPGTYWYTDQDSGLPRKLDVTPELTKYWCDQGNSMLSSDLTIPVPYEHDFSAHPMTPKDNLLNNGGWTKEYRLHDGKGGKGDKLHAVLDIQDEEVYKKLPRTIRWVSPWINSFTDGKGKKWNNVISHIALTTRPRIVNQSPFPSIAAALSMAGSTIRYGSNSNMDAVVLPQGGYCLTRATQLTMSRSDGITRPLYPMAFSLMSGVSFGEGEFPPKKGKKPPPKAGGDKSGVVPKKSGVGDPTTTADNFGGEGEGEEGAVPGAEGGEEGSNVDLPPLGDKAGDVSMEEVLCDLLRALGVNVEHSGDETQFKRSLYAATMQKVHELTNKGMNKEEEPKPGAISKDKVPGSPGQQQQNPIIQQEQQPMYMSLEEINKISDITMKTIALSMYNENVKLKAQVDANEKVANSLRDGKLKDATALRTQRVAMLSKVSPRVKSDLEAMLALPSMALSMGDGGSVVDPMSTTLMVLEKGLSDLPKLLTTDSSLHFAQPQPTDQDMMSAEQEQSVVDILSRMMGVPPENKKAG